MKTETQRDYGERILRVLVHIQQHLDHALDLDELAGIAHFSPFHFHRIFRGMVGEAVQEHIRRLRLERAAYRLKCGTQPITHVAFDAGYDAHEAFTRAFKAVFGQSPSAFREQHRPLRMPPVPSGVHYDPEGRLDEFEAIRVEEATMEVRIENVQPMRVAFVRHVGPYDQVGRTWQKLCTWAGMRGLFGPNTQLFGISHDDPDVTPPDKLRYDACIVVSDAVQPEGEVGVQEVAGGRYAVAMHRGPYSKFGETYAALLGQWLPARGHEPVSSPCLEFYRNNPNTTAPEDLLTDIYVPLRASHAAVEVSS
jgi:AraC family transcriptional regulator